MIKDNQISLRVRGVPADDPKYIPHVDLWVSFAFAKREKLFHKSFSLQLDSITNYLILFPDVKSKASFIPCTKNKTKENRYNLPDDEIYHAAIHFFDRDVEIIRSLTKISNDIDRFSASGFIRNQPYGRFYIELEPSDKWVPISRYKRVSKTKPIFVDSSSEILPANLSVPNVVSSPQEVLPLIFNQNLTGDQLIKLGNHMNAGGKISIENNEIFLFTKQRL